MYKVIGKFFICLVMISYLFGMIWQIPATHPYVILSLFTIWSISPYAGMLVLLRSLQSGHESYYMIISVVMLACVYGAFDIIELVRAPSDPQSGISFILAPVLPWFGVLLLVVLMQVRVKK